MFISQVFAVTILYLWLKCIEYAGAFSPTGVIVRISVNMLKTILRFLLVIILALLAFGHVFLIIFGQHAAPRVFDNLGFSMLTLFRGILADFEFDTIDATRDWMAIAAFVLFVIIGPLLLFNLLIAIMTNAYENVRQDSEGEFLIGRAQVIHKVSIPAV